MVTVLFWPRPPAGGTLAEPDGGRSASSVEFLDEEAVSQRARRTPGARPRRASRAFAWSGWRDSRETWIKRYQRSAALSMAGSPPSSSVEPDAVKSASKANARHAHTARHHGHSRGLAGGFAALEQRGAGRRQDEQPAAAASSPSEPLPELCRLDARRWQPSDIRRSRGTRGPPGILSGLHTSEAGRGSRRTAPEPLSRTR